MALAPTWKPYFEELIVGDDDEAIRHWDVVAAAAAPLASHPLRIELTAPLLKPKPDGSARIGEADALNRAFDAQVSTLRSKLEVLAVGTCLVRGQAQATFYAPASFARKLPALQAALKLPAGYAPTLTSQSDPRWLGYFKLFSERAYLNELKRSRALLRRVVAGDTAPRECRYRFEHPDADDAKRLAKDLRSEGFKVGPLQARDEGGCTLEASATHPPVLEAMAQNLHLALVSAELNGGRYLGWTWSTPGR